MKAEKQKVEKHHKEHRRNGREYGDNNLAAPQVLQIDPEFQALVLPLTKEEYDLLEQNLVSDGFDSAYPIITWNGIIVDGHNCYELSLKLTKCAAFCPETGGLSARDGGAVQFARDTEDDIPRGIR